VHRIRAEGVSRALERSDLMLLAILKARDPWFMPQPKQVTHEHKHDGPPPSVNISSMTNVAFGHFTDEEMETFDRLLKKAGVPEQLLKPAPPVIDVDSQTVTEAQPSRGDGDRGSK
jgi:hypothetical protein